MTKYRSQRRKFGRFVLILFGFMCLCQLPVAWLILKSTSLPWWGMGAIVLFLNTVLGIRIWFVPRKEAPPVWFERYGVWGYFAVAVSCMYGAVFALVVRWLDWSHSTVGIGLSCCLALGLYSVGFPWRRVAVRRVSVPIPGLPADFDGFRIAHISDLHAGPMSPEWRLKSWVRRVNRLKPDLVLITGDMVATGQSFVPSLERSLALLEVPSRAVACMGNHDYFGQADEAIVAMYKRLGIQLLCNSHTHIEPASGSSSLVLAGVDDTWQGNNDLGKAMEGARTDLPVLLLSHDPRVFEEVVDQEDYPIALQFSGHTHGGQLAVPFLGRATSVLSIFGVAWSQGLYERNGRWLHVSAGLGTTGAPVRIGVPSEMSIVQLKSIPSE